MPTQSPSAVTELLAVAQQLGAAGFPTLLVGILFGSYKGWWVWGRNHLEMQEDYERRLLKAEASSDRWESMALKAAGLAEDSVGLAKKSAK